MLALQPGTYTAVHASAVANSSRKSGTPQSRAFAHVADQNLVHASVKSTAAAESAAASVPASSGAAFDREEEELHATTKMAHASGVAARRKTDFTRAAYKNIVGL
jgi:hypothetical protein